VRYDSEHRERTRQRILQVAAAAIRKQGISRIALADVMSGAELTHGGFYLHFKSKDDLIAEAITYMFDERYGRFLERFSDADAQEALSAFIDFYLSVPHLEAPERGCPVPTLASDVAHLPDDARRRFVAGVALLIDGLAALLERAGVADPRQQANSMLAELAGSLNLARTLGGGSSVTEALEASRHAMKQRFGIVGRG
jgi:TetR/AcrR family transcriptional regulator, transcriptional repressor for nem operon